MEKVTAEVIEYISGLSKYNLFRKLGFVPPL